MKLKIIQKNKIDEASFLDKFRPKRTQEPYKPGIYDPSKDPNYKPNYGAADTFDWENLPQGQVQQLNWGSSDQEQSQQPDKNVTDQDNKQKEKSNQANINQRTGKVLNPQRSPTGRAEYARKFNAVLDYIKKTGDYELINLFGRLINSKFPNNLDHEFENDLSLIGSEFDKLSASYEKGGAADYNNYVKKYYALRSILAFAANTSLNKDVLDTMGDPESFEQRKSAIDNLKKQINIPKPPTRDQIIAAQQNKAEPEPQDQAVEPPQQKQTQQDIVPGKQKTKQPVASLEKILSSLDEFKKDDIKNDIRKYIKAYRAANGTNHSVIKPGVKLEKILKHLYDNNHNSFPKMRRALQTATNQYSVQATTGAKKPQKKQSKQQSSSSLEEMERIKKLAGIT